MIWSKLIKIWGSLVVLEIAVKGEIRTKIANNEIT